MNQMQQMLANAQRMQRNLEKANAEIRAKEYSVSKNGMVDLVMMGDRSVKSLKINKEAFDPENQELIEETIALALSEALAQIDKDYNEAEEKITGQRGGLF